MEEGLELLMIVFIFLLFPYGQGYLCVQSFP
jgi:hypothetical protein